MILSKEMQQKAVKMNKIKLPSMAEYLTLTPKFAKELGLI
jgi:hypothetical protein